MHKLLDKKKLEKVKPDFFDGITTFYYFQFILKKKCLYVYIFWGKSRNLLLTIENTF